MSIWNITYSAIRQIIPLVFKNALLPIVYKYKFYTCIKLFFYIKINIMIIFVKMCLTKLCLEETFLFYFRNMFIVWNFETCKMYYKYI